jgi:hypothetical protein
MTSLHFPLLLLSALLPYVAVALGRYPDNPLAAMLFGLDVGALLLCRAGLQTAAGRGGVLLPDVDRHRHETRRNADWIALGYWILTLPLTWWTPWVQIPWFLAILVDAAADYLLKRRLNHRKAPDRPASGHSP